MFLFIHGLKKKNSPKTTAEKTAVKEFEGGSLFWDVKELKTEVLFAKQNLDVASQAPET